MRKLFFAVVGNALALWLTTLIIREFSVVPYEDEPLAYVLTFALVALIFALVNATLGTVIRILTFPLYILTLGLFSIVVNALVLYLVHWLSEQMGFGLAIEGGFFWIGFWAAIVFALINWIIGMILRPIAKR